MEKATFGELATAAYCPRKLYYRVRDDDWSVPASVTDRRELAFRYHELLASDDLAGEPIAVPPDEWRENLGRARDRECWSAVVDPEDRDLLVDGRRCRGIVHKVLDLGGPVPSVVSAGVAPDDGAWEPDTVRAVAAAKALSWEHETPVEQAIVEYPACGVVRPIDVTTRRKATYRRALRVVESLDGPPPRLRNRSKCEPCEFRGTCGVRTRTLGSLLDRVTSGR